MCLLHAFAMQAKHLEYNIYKTIWIRMLCIQYAQNTNDQFYGNKNVVIVVW